MVRFRLAEKIHYARPLVIWINGTQCNRQICVEHVLIKPLLITQGFSQRVGRSLDGHVCGWVGSMWWLGEGGDYRGHAASCPTAAEARVPRPACRLIQRSPRDAFVYPLVWQLFTLPFRAGLRSLRHTSLTQKHRLAMSILPLPTCISRHTQTHYSQARQSSVTMFFLRHLIVENLCQVNIKFISLDFYTNAVVYVVN